MTNVIIRHNGGVSSPYFLTCITCYPFLLLTPLSLLFFFYRRYVFAHVCLSVCLFVLLCWLVNKMIIYKLWKGFWSNLAKWMVPAPSVHNIGTTWLIFFSPQVLHIYIYSYTYTFHIHRSKYHKCSYISIVESWKETLFLQMTVESFFSPMQPPQSILKHILPSVSESLPIVANFLYFALSLSFF